MKKENLQMNILLKKEIKDKLDKLARQKSVELDKTVSAIDIVRDLIDGLLEEHKEKLS